MAASKGITLSQFAIAWLLARNDYIVPIPGSRNPDRLAQNIAVVVVVLTTDDLARITDTAPTDGVARAVTAPDSQRRCSAVLTGRCSGAYETCVPGCEN